jgi:ADP-heptose:LPS heptosyltransferase
MVDQYMEFVRHLGLSVTEPVHLLPSHASAETRAGELVRELGGAPILVNLGASKPANRWVPGRFGELALEASRRFAHPVCLIGGPDDRALFRADLERIGSGSEVHDLVGATSLEELWALERRSRLFVGLDTGPMHLAAAVGLPCVILFGAADPRRTGPWGDRHRVVRIDVPCSPCNKRECRMPRHICMEDLGVEPVLAAMAEILERVPAKG